VSWLFSLIVRDADRRAIESDLAELFELKRRTDGDRAARRWLRRQRVLYPLHVIGDRLRAIPAFGRRLMSHLWRDLVYSARSLIRTPALTATIVLTVGVGLGATTGMLAVIRAVLINPLPYADAESIFWIYTDNAPYRFRFSVVDYRAFEQDHPAFSEIAAYQSSRVTVSEGGEADRVTAKSVTGSYFPLMRQRPLLGRLFEPKDDTGGDRIAVLTAPYWRRRFGGDPNVLGRTMTIDGGRYTIVGVLEPADGPLENGVAFFTAARWPEPKRKGPFFTMAIARLRPDVSETAALTTLKATNARLFPIWRSSYQDEKATWGLQDLKSRVVGDVGSTLVAALAAVACVLLIACANAVNLLIARALNRGRDLAIRGALGASRGRLIQHLLAESGVLTIGATLVGLAVAAGTVVLVTTYGTTFIPRLSEVRLSGAVLAWLGGLAIVSGLIIFAGGLVPALNSTRLRMDHVLRSSGRSTTDGPGARRLRHALVAAEFALATPLIVAAVLVLLSLQRLNHVEVGIDTARILTAGVSLPGGLYPDEDSRREFWQRTLTRLETLPGVERAALADSRPPDDAGQSNNFELEDRPTPPGQNQPICIWVGASPGFFKAVGLRLERGRLLDAQSLQNDEVVVDRAWVQRFFPGEEVVGRRMHQGGCTTCPWTTVVGVVGTVKFAGLDTPDRGTIYYPFVDLPATYVVLRTPGDPASLVSSLRQAMRELDPNLALTDIATGDEGVSDSLVAPRYLTVLIGMFGAAALILSVVGVYGVMAYFVQQRTRDIGIRLALGGEPAAMRRMVVKQGLRLVLGGIVVGVAAAFLTARLLTTLLFGVSATDPWTMTLVPIALMAVAMIACLVPARRAASLDPASILRES